MFQFGHQGGEKKDKQTNKKPTLVQNNECIWLSQASSSHLDGGQTRVKEKESKCLQAEGRVPMNAYAS